MLKDGAPHLGVRTAGIRRILTNGFDGLDTAAGSLEDRAVLGRSLVECKHTEEKIAGMIVLQEYVIPHCDSLPDVLSVENLASLFTHGFIYDWNVCDWLCVRVLGQLIAREGDVYAENILGWHAMANQWQCRASIVSFVNLLGDDRYIDRISEATRVIIRRPERFCKTGVGCVSREMSRNKPEVTQELIDSSIEWFSVESFRNAAKYLGEEKRRSMLKKLKPVSQ